ncbi:YceG family protein [Anaerotruncus sp.]|uniref:YceG family protein n=1 Tax=Anaerotruncus TaxID=244127 RepID=UPI0021702731|nr:MULTISPECIES: YceG family protein [Anaerotruncus]MCI8493808.1 hypothetical protein [Anaerotruncus sp.]
MSSSHPLGQCFLPVEQRVPQSARFYCVIGRDAGGAVLADLQAFYQLTRSEGLYILDGIDNPVESEITRFYNTVGERFAFTREFISRHITMWLGQVRPAQRDLLAAALAESLSLLKKQGSNDNIIRNAYIKFMCWLRSRFGPVLIKIGKPSPPKILFEGDISKYEALLLHALHLAGCDVVYVDFCSDASYQKADPTGTYSELVRGAILSMPPLHFAACAGGNAPPSARQRPEPPKSEPCPWEHMADQPCVNTWAGGTPPTEAVMRPASRRGGGLYSLFAVWFGADERAEYRNRLFHLKAALDGSAKQWLLLDQNLSAPSVEETAPFRGIDKRGARGDLIRRLAERLAPSCGQVRRLSVQRAFAQAMERVPIQDLVRLFNYGVRLACWITRYMDRLCAGKTPDETPAVVRYGSITETELPLFWVLAQAGIDVLCFFPDPSVRDVFTSAFLPIIWTETLFKSRLPVEPFPTREERVRASTAAYNASRELDQLLYNDTGMFRDRQFTRSRAVTLRATYDEVWQLWHENAQFRPSFEAKDGVVYVPNLFVKICGVERGDINAYWRQIRGLVGEDTYLLTDIAADKSSGIPADDVQKRCLHGDKLDPVAVKKESAYAYSHLPDDLQDYILEKIQDLIDFQMLAGGQSNLPANIVSVLSGINVELVRLIQNFDFTREIPKVVSVDVDEKMFSLSNCIVLAFLNLVGFDIAIFTPTGYKNIEHHLRADCFDTLIAGEYEFNLTVPKLQRSDTLLGRLFGPGKSS